MGFYPVYLNLTGRRCVVIGGGVIGERKAQGLLDADADVTVVSPTLTPALREHHDYGRILWIGREYRPGDLEGYELCMVATDDGAVNSDVAREGRSRGVWVNASDDPPNCDFILPSILRRGQLQIAVSTEGRSPALSRRVREELEEQFGPEYGELVALIGEVRDEERADGRMFSTANWLEALAPDLRDLLRGGQPAEARKRLVERLRQGAATT